MDIETLTETNEKLIATMDDVLRIQREGHEKRVAAEAQMAKSNPSCAKSSLMSPASTAVPQNKPAFQSIVLNRFITAESNSGKAER